MGPGGAPSISTLTSFVATVYKARGHVASIHANWQNVVEDGQDAVSITPEDLQTAVKQWEHPWQLGRPSVPQGAGHKPTTPAWKPAVSPVGVNVAVQNGNGVDGAATKAATQLDGWGYAAVSGGDAPNYKYPATFVYYKPGSKGPATDVAHIMGVSQPLPLPASYPVVKKPIVVVLGKTYTGKLAVAPPKPDGSGSGTKLPSTMSHSDEVKPYFAAARKKTHFRVLYPTVAQDDSFFCPWAAVPDRGIGLCSYPNSNPIRTYNIPAAGDGTNSMYAMFGMGNPEMPLGNFWGIEETTFTDAPILDAPNATRKLDGRTYLFFYNAEHIHTIGFVNGDVAYWVQNTLTDGLTNAEMIAIARSLKPA